MLKTVEAVLEKDGRLRLTEHLDLTHPQRVLVTFLEEKTDSDAAFEAALLSEAALAEDWDRTEEDQAWQHLQ